MFKTPKLKNSANPPRPREPVDVDGTEGTFATGFGHEALGGNQGMKREAVKLSRVGKVSTTTSGPPGWRKKGK